MSREVWLRRCRGGMVVLASGALISLSTLTGGIAPALAGPGAPPINSSAPAAPAAPRPAPAPPPPHPPLRLRGRHQSRRRLPGWSPRLRFTMMRRLRFRRHRGLPFTMQHRPRRIHKPPRR